MQLSAESQGASERGGRRLSLRRGRKLENWGATTPPSPPQQQQLQPCPRNPLQRVPPAGNVVPTIPKCCCCSPKKHSPASPSPQTSAELPTAPTLTWARLFSLFLSPTQDTARGWDSCSGMAPGTSSPSHLSPQHGGHPQPGCAPQGGIVAHPWEFFAQYSLPSQPGLSESLREVGEELLHLQQTTHPQKTPSQELTPPSNTLTAAEPPLPDGSGASPHRREPELSAGCQSRRSLLKPFKALDAEAAPHYRTGSQLVPRRIWDGRYWLGRWLKGSQLGWGCLGASHQGIPENSLRGSSVG